MSNFIQLIPKEGVVLVWVRIFLNKKDDSLKYKFKRKKTSALKTRKHMVKIGGTSEPI